MIKKFINVTVFILVINISPSVLAEMYFSPNVRVDNSNIGTGDQKHPAIAIGADDIIYTTWDGGPLGIDNNIYFARSLDKGRTFEPSIQVNDSAPQQGMQKHPRVRLDHNQNVYLVWDDSRDPGGPQKIYFAKSTDQGVTFSPNIRIDDAPSIDAYQRHPQMAIDQAGNINVVWFDDRENASFDFDIYFTRSTDGGQTFSPNIRINEQMPLDDTHSYPDIAVDNNGFIYVTWSSNPLTNFNNTKIYFSRSMDGGQTFSPKTMVNDSNSTTNRGDSHIAVDNYGNVFVTWSDWRNGAPDVYFSRSTDGGVTFETDIRINDNPITMNTQQYGSRIAVDIKGNPSIIYESNQNGNFDVYFTKSYDQGATFQPSKKITDDADNDQNQFYVEIATDHNKNIFAIWDDSRSGEYDIYFSKGVDKCPENSISSLDYDACLEY